LNELYEKKKELKFRGLPGVPDIEENKSDIGEIAQFRVGLPWK
jgi:hypothetical protein